MVEPLNDNLGTQANCVGPEPIFGSALPLSPGGVGVRLRGSHLRGFRTDAVQKAPFVTGPVRIPTLQSELNGYDSIRIDRIQIIHTLVQPPQTGSQMAPQVVFSQPTAIACGIFPA